MAHLALSCLRQHGHHKKEGCKEADYHNIKCIEVFQEPPVEAAKCAIRIGQPDERPKDEADHNGLADQGNLETMAFVCKSQLRPV